MKIYVEYLESNTDKSFTEYYISQVEKYIIANKAKHLAPLEMGEGACWNCNEKVIIKDKNECMRCYVERKL